MFILDFLCIHPFNDGNGRMSRLLNLFQESCTVQCNVRGTYNYHSISAEKIMPGKTKAKKGDGAVNRILEDANSTRFWVHTYDDDPISRLQLKIRGIEFPRDLPKSISI